MFISAYDSKGSAVPASSISVIGLVNPQVSGIYGLVYSFVDSNTGVTVKSIAQVTVSSSSTITSTYTPALIGTDNTIVTKAVTVPIGGTWSAINGLVSATDSRGNAVSTANIKVIGSINTSISGAYVVNYSFTDPYTQQVNQNDGIVIVTATSGAIWSTISPMTNYSIDAFKNSSALNPYRYNVVEKKDILYYGVNDGSLISSNTVAITAAQLDSTVYVRGEKTATDSTGTKTTFDNISFDGKTWYWINESDLASSSDLTSVSHKSGTSLATNSFNLNGQIIWQAGSTQYVSLISQAAANWNKALGKTVFVEATSTTPLSSINLVVSDYSDNTVGTLAYYDPNVGHIALNIGHLGQTGDKNTTVIQNVITHEMGHSLGLNHVGDWVATSNGINVSTTPAQSWSFGTYTDIMWATSLGDSYPIAQSVISTNDINTINMILLNHNFFNTLPYVPNDSSYNLPIIE